MESTSFIWVVLLCSALVAGACFVGVLVVRRHAEFVVSVAGIGSFALASYSLFVLATIFERADVVLYAFAILTAGIVGGWSLASSLLDRLAGTYSVGRLPSDAPEDNGSVAAVLLSCVEPRQYDPVVTAGSLRSLADDGMIEPSITTLPFMFFAQKTRYRAIGGTSPAQGQLQTLAERLEQSLGQTRVKRVDIAACSGRDQLATKVLEAAQMGYRTIVVTRLGVAESSHLSEARAVTDGLHLSDIGVRVAYTDLLGTADRLVGMLSQRVMSHVSNQDATGVVLVGHGQPESWAKRNPDFDHDETAFLSRIRMNLIDSGLAERNIRVAWAEWQSPDVTSAVRHLAALGCRRVVVLPGVFAVDTIGTRLDLELAVRQARVDDDVSVVTLPAWRDDDEVVEEITDRIEAELAQPAT